VIAALILGKAVLIADLMPFIKLYPHKPLIYNVVWKTAIYLLIATLIHYTERLFEFWKAAGSFAAANERMLAEIVWPHFWAVQILLLVLILFYSTMRELVRVIGRDKVLEIFFLGPPPDGELERATIPRASYPIPVLKPFPRRRPYWTKVQYVALLICRKV